MLATQLFKATKFGVFFSFLAKPSAGKDAEQSKLTLQVGMQNGMRSYFPLWKIAS